MEHEVALASRQNWINMLRAAVVSQSAHGTDPVETVLELILKDIEFLRDSAPNADYREGVVAVGNHVMSLIQGF